MPNPSSNSLHTPQVGAASLLAGEMAASSSIKRVLGTPFSVAPSDLLAIVNAGDAERERSSNPSKCHTVERLFFLANIAQELRRKGMERAANIVMQHCENFQDARRFAAELSAVTEYSRVGEVWTDVRKNWLDKKNQTDSEKAWHHIGNMISGLDVVWSHLKEKTG